MDHQYPAMYPSAPPTPGNMETALVGVAAYPPGPAQGLPVRPQQLGGGAPTDGDRSGWAGNDPSTLLVVATLLVALAYLLGLSMPGGYWQQDTPAWSGGERVVYRAGDPIIRDLHRPRYWVFRAASWVGVASSMVLTLSLLVRTPAGSRHVQWSFVVAYSSLLLTFAVSQTKTHLSLDIIVWLAVLAVSWLITTTSIRGGNRARIMKLLCCGGGGDN